MMTQYLQRLLARQEFPSTRAARSFGSVCVALLMLAACAPPNTYGETKAEIDSQSGSMAPAQVTMAERSGWKEMRRQFALHTKLTDKEVACGLTSAPNEYNIRSAPEINLSVLECLQVTESHRAAWKAFLYSVDQFESDSDPCVARLALLISLRTEHFAIISDHNITGDQAADRIDPLALGVSFLSLEKVKNAFLDRRPGFTRRFLDHLALCKKTDEKGQHFADMVRLRNFLNAEDRK